MKSDSSKIYRRLLSWVILSVVSLAAVVAGLVLNLGFVFSLGMIFLLIFGDTLFSVLKPVLHHRRLLNALCGLNDKQITDWFVLDASYSEQRDFLAYLDAKSRLTIFYQWNIGVYYYQRKVSMQRYRQALMHLMLQNSEKL